jgi:predicted esterase
MGERLRPMKMKISTLGLALLVIAGFSTPSELRAQQLNPAIQVKERKIEKNQHYFLISHREDPAEKKGLVIILPGGPGDRNFLPFCANVLTRLGVPKGFVAAQLIAPEWSDDPNRIVWPSVAIPDEKAEFTTEAFIRAVINDAGTEVNLDKSHIFTLGWSSSGPALYSASTRVSEVTGSIIAMSRFFPATSVEKDKAKGKNYFLYHSRKDQICPFADAEQAVKTLTELEANVKLVEYDGAHGWEPGEPHWETIKGAIAWLIEGDAE